MNKIVPFAKPIPKLDAFATMTFCDGFEFNPTMIPQSVFIKACLESLGLDDTPDDYSLVEVNMASIQAIVSKDQAIIGIVFPQNCFQTKDNHGPN